MAFDDSRDDEWDPTNNITRVDIALDEYDWIELYPPINVIPNAQGGYNWFYDWDTTEWNGTALQDGNYTLKARAWDKYHFSHMYEIQIAINNTNGNTPRKIFSRLTSFSAAPSVT